MRRVKDLETDKSNLARALDHEIAAKVLMQKDIDMLRNVLRDRCRPFAFLPRRDALVCPDKFVCTPNHVILGEKHDQSTARGLCLCPCLAS